MVRKQSPETLTVSPQNSMLHPTSTAASPDDPSEKKKTVVSHRMNTFRMDPSDLSPKSPQEYMLDDLLRDVLKYEPIENLFDYIHENFDQLKLDGEELLSSSLSCALTSSEHNSATSTTATSNLIPRGHQPTPTITITAQSLSSSTTTTTTITINNNDDDANQ